MLGPLLNPGVTDRKNPQFLSLGIQSAGRNGHKDILQYSPGS